MSEKSFDRLPPHKDRGPTILIADNQESARAALSVAVRSAANGESFNILFADSLDQVFEITSHTTLDVILLDKNFSEHEDTPEHNGLNYIPEILKLQPHVQILVVTASRDIQDAVTAVKNGAFGFLTKEDSPELMIAQIHRAVSVAQLAKDKMRVERALSQTDLNPIGGKSRAIIECVHQAEVVAESDRPVLLLGESGVGKTTLAKLIHDHRQKFLKEERRPFFALNIAALSSDLAERELFGNERGAYTDAKEQKLGFFELVHNGTLFLDEIGDASLELQVKLLKVIDEGIFYRLGGTKMVSSKFKLICATHRNLEELVEQGLFREDLYYRISTFKVRVPSLIERKEDIPEIIRAALPRWCRDNRVTISFEEFPKELIDHLADHPPQGNVRGIEQQISRLLVLSPRDKTGRPIFDNWKVILGRGGGKSSPSAKQRSLTLDDFLKSPLDVVNSGFPGLPTFLESITERVFIDAKNKLKANRAVAKALKVSTAKASIKTRQYMGKINGSKKIGRTKDVF